MQLVAYGAQDVYLTGNPQITFFKVVYRRHTNFAIEAIEQTFNGTSDFGKRVTATISRNGDLITNCILEVTVPKLVSEEGDTVVIDDTQDPPVLDAAGAKQPVSLVNTNGNKTNVLNIDGANSAPLVNKAVPSGSEWERRSELVQACVERGHARWVKWLGHFLVKSVEVEIGGQRIDKHYGHWLQVWHELSRNCCQDSNYNKMIGNTVHMNNPGRLLKVDPVTCGIVNSAVDPSVTIDNDSNTLANTTGVESSDVGSVPETTLYIPLQFWFNRNVGLGLPLIALQYHEVKINFEFEELDRLTLGKLKSDCCRTMQKCSLYVDYIYLDTDERRRFAQVSHEYLIEQVQFTGDESITSPNAKVRLNFNHPVKEIVWTCSSDQHSSHTHNVHVEGGATVPIVHSAQKNYANYTADPNSTQGGNPTNDAKLQLNGHDRFSTRPGTYFNNVQPWQHHSNSPSAGINVYSFALKPEEHQPSGTCNFSRIDNATLILTINGLEGSNDSATAARTVDYTLRVYAVNYNVLRIMSGMGGLAYSN